VQLLDAFDDLVRRSECCSTSTATEQHRTSLSSFRNHRPSPGSTSTKYTLFVFGRL